ncbi:MAG: hypothetical protein LAN59_11920 [Acidobacteriia bacterium]|nr:hypothetical protein [Terriglobia bacterium]
MDPTLVTSALTSLGVSALTTLCFQTYLTKRIEHHFQRQLAQFKANLELQVHAKQEIANRRLEAYPKLIESSYRTRNMARDLLQAGVSADSLQELVARVRELEDMVFRYRVDLESDNVFVLVHRYKNLLREFYRIAADLQPSANRAESSTMGDRLAEAYAAIDGCYAEVVHTLTADVNPETRQNHA